MLYRNFRTIESFLSVALLFDDMYCFAQRRSIGRPYEDLSLTLGVTEEIFHVALFFSNSNDDQLSAESELIMQIFNNKNRHHDLVTRQ